jgi:hypothetical protein
MIPKSGYRFPACAKPCQRLVVAVDASAGEGRSEKIMLKQKLSKMVHRRIFKFFRHEATPAHFIPPSGPPV